MDPNTCLTLSESAVTAISQLATHGITINESDPIEWTWPLTIGVFILSGLIAVRLWFSLWKYYHA